MSLSKEFWERFEAAYPQDYLILKEILPADKLAKLNKMDKNDEEQLYFLHSWLASFFRDAIEYGYNIGYHDKESRRLNRYGTNLKFMHL